MNWLKVIPCKIFAIFAKAMLEMVLRKPRDTYTRKLQKFSMDNDWYQRWNLIIYSPGIIKATLSNVVASCSGEQQLSFNSGTCWVRHIRGPSAQRQESNSTDKLPETAICPYKRGNLIYAILFGK